jgi:hypothetical protein
MHDDGGATAVVEKMKRRRQQNDGPLVSMARYFHFNINKRGTQSR